MPSLGGLLGAAVIFQPHYFVTFLHSAAGFIWDDDRLLTESRIIKSSQGLYRIWCTDRSRRLLARDKYRPLDRVAFMGNQSNWLPRCEPDLALCRFIADLDRFAEITHPRCFFGGPDFRRPPGECRVGGMDCSAEKHPLDVVFPLVDPLVSDVRHTHGNRGHESHTFPRRTVGTKKNFFILHPSSFILSFLVLVEFSGLRLGNVRQGIGGRFARSVAGNRLLAAQN